MTAREKNVGHRPRVGRSINALRENLCQKKKKSFCAGPLKNEENGLRKRLDFGGREKNV